MVIIVQRHGEEDAQTRNCEEEEARRKESRGTDACIEDLREYHGPMEAQKVSCFLKGKS